MKLTYMPISANSWSNWKIIVRSTQSVNYISQDTPRPTNMAAPDYAPKNSHTMTRSQSPVLRLSTPVHNQICTLTLTHTLTHETPVLSVITDLVWPWLVSRFLCSVFALGLYAWPKPLFDPEFVSRVWICLHFSHFAQHKITATASVSAFSFMRMIK